VVLDHDGGLRLRRLTAGAAEFLPAQSPRAAYGEASAVALSERAVALRCLDYAGWLVSVVTWP
jgi:hypothetical protein